MGIKVKELKANTIVPGSGAYDADNLRLKTKLPAFSIPRRDRRRRRREQRLPREQAPVQLRAQELY